MKKRVLKIVGFVLLLFLIANPETMLMASLLDVVGIELFLFLFAVQFRMVRDYFYFQFIQPVRRFFAGFASHPVFMPSGEVLRQEPALLAFSFSIASVLMFCVLCIAPLLLIYQLIG